LPQNSNIFANLQNKPQTGLFASTQPSTAQGGIGIFGSSNQQQQGTQANLNLGSQQFGAFNQTAFGAPKNVLGTYNIKYQVTTVDEPTFNKQGGGNQKPIPIKLISITAMNEFSQKSLEELRIEDHRLKKSGTIPQIHTNPQGIGMLGAQGIGSNQSLFGQQQNQPQPTGLFSSNIGTQINQLQGSSMFGGANNQSSLFGKPQPSQTNTSGGVGLFGNSSASNLGSGLTSQSQSSFGQQTNQQSLFGQKPAPQSTSLFTTTSQQNLQTPNAQQPGGLFGGLGLGQSQQQSSLFTAAGQQPQVQPTVSLFGQTQQPTNPTSSLFGNQTQGQNTSGGLFGLNTQPQQQQANSLFGGAAQQAQTGGLFGAATKPLGTSLFGGTSQPVSTGSSLFSAPSAVVPPQNTSLFGAPNTSSSLFGGQTQQSATSSLLGGQQAKPTTSLFGGATQSSNTTSLFGPAQTTTTSSLFGTQPASSSLFGQQTSQIQAPASQVNSLFGGDLGIKSGLFGAAPSTGQVPDLNTVQQNISNLAKPTNAYLDLINVGKKSIEEILEDIQKDYLEAQFDNSFKKIQTKSSNIYNEEFKRFYPEMMPFDLQNKYTDYQFYQKDGDKSEYYRSSELSYMDSFLKTKRGFGYGKRFDLLEPSPIESRRILSHGNILKQIQLNKEREMLKNLHINQDDLERNYKNLEKPRFNFYKDNTRKISDLYEKCYQSSELIKSQSSVSHRKQESNHTINNLENEVGNLILERKGDLAEIYEISVILQDPIKFTTRIKILKTKSVVLLKKTIADELCEKHPVLFRKLKEDSFLLMKNHTIIKEDSSIENSKINDGDTIYILLYERFEKIKFKDEPLRFGRKNSSSPNDKENCKKKKNINNKIQIENKNEMAPIEMIPKMERKNYFTIPTYSEICRMSLQELENVQDFTIYNEFGKIVFDDHTNLTDLNIDQIVSINEREITLYRNGKANETPEIGKGLNKPATIYMNKLFPENICEEDYDENEDYPKFLASLEELCKTMGVNRYF